MIWLVLSIICVALASICNSVMDTLVHHYHASIFNTGDAEDNQYYNPKISWLNKYVGRDVLKGRLTWIVKIPTKIKIRGGFDADVKDFDTKIKVHPFFTDAWHFYKSLMVVLLCAAVTFAMKCGIDMDWWVYILYFIGLGTVWNVNFSAFYNRFLIKKV